MLKNVNLNLIVTCNTVTINFAWSLDCISIHILL